MRRILSVHLPTALWTGLVTFALLTPGSDAPPPPWLAWLEAPGVDKLIHVALFFLQALLVARTGGGFGGRRWPAMLLAALYGLLLEVAQIGVAGRGFELGDLLADAVGALLGALAYRPRPRG